jgi:hypothetical protein
MTARDTSLFRKLVQNIYDLIDNTWLIKIARPIIRDGHVRSYWRELRWSRNDQSRFCGLLDIQTFGRRGGWFLFYGTKRQQEHEPGRIRLSRKRS